MLFIERTLTKLLCNLSPYSVPNLSVATATNLLLHPKPSAYNQSVSFSQQELYDSNYTMHTQPSSVVVHRQGSDRTKGPRPTSQPVMSENYLLSSQEDLGILNDIYLFSYFINALVN